GRLEHLAPSWMKEKSLEITDRHSPLVDKFFHDLTKIFAHQSGEFWAQHDAKAIALTSHPIICRVFRQVCSPNESTNGLSPPAVAPSVDARRTTPAAPSPNRAAATNIAMLGSLGRAQRLQRSTVMKSTFRPGRP